MANPILTVEEVRAYIEDFPANNHLLDNQEEFKDSQIEFAISLAVDEWNVLPPRSFVDVTSFPSKSLLLYGTLWKLFDGKAALLIRNTLSYSDGGLQIPIEERSELYRGLSADFREKFVTAATKLKTNMNLDEGWGELRSDLSMTPFW